MYLVWFVFFSFYINNCRILQLTFPREVSLNFVKYKRVCMKNDAVAFWQTISFSNDMALLCHFRVITDGV